MLIYVDITGEDEKKKDFWIDPHTVRWIHEVEDGWEIAFHNLPEAQDRVLIKNRVALEQIVREANIPPVVKLAGRVSTKI